MIPSRFVILLLGGTWLAILTPTPTANAFAPAAIHVPTASSSSSSSSSLAATNNGDSNKSGGFFQGVSDFFAELDAFIDDASARRLGNGAAFYGKRKSNFYGENDKMKKVDRNARDATEDYQGPSTAGYFKWMPDEDGAYTVNYVSCFSPMTIFIV